VAASRPSGRLDPLESGSAARNGCPTSERYLSQSDDGRAPSARFCRSVAELKHEFRTSQDGAHDLTLHAYAASVNNPQRLQAERVSFFQIGLDDILNVARLNCVEIEDIGDGNADGLVGTVQSPILLKQLTGESVGDTLDQCRRRGNHGLPQLT